MNAQGYVRCQRKGGTIRSARLLALLALLTPIPPAQINASKAEVSEHIRRVEDGVDEFRNYLERRGGDARDAASQSQGRRSRSASDQQKATATAKKDELSKALDGLNSTNRLRREFDKTDAWVKTRVDVERVLDDGRKINQVVARGNYGADAARLWAALRTQIWPTVCARS